MKRNNSTVELLRIILLFFLIATHWGHFWMDPAGKLIDTKIIQGITVISVSGFAMITGIYVYGNRSLFYRNVSRLLFIILISIIIGFTLFPLIGINFSGQYSRIFSGSRDSWYLYGILGVYLIGPFLKNFLQKLRAFTPLILGISLILLIEIARVLTQAKALFQGDVSTFFFLFALTLIGNSLSRITWSRKTINITFMSIGAASLSVIVVLAVYCNVNVFQHELPTTTLLAMSAVALAFYNPFYSKWINWLTKRLYFVYEYHWYWQFLWNFLFAKFVKDQPHLQLYVNWIVIFLFGSVMSMIITELQVRVWNKYVDPQMLKAISWTKSKLIKPKANN